MVPRDLWEAPAPEQRVIAQELRKLPNVEMGVAPQEGAPLQAQTRQNVEPTVRPTMGFADPNSPMPTVQAPPDRTPGAMVPTSPAPTEFTPNATTEYSWNGRQAKPNPERRTPAVLESALEKVRDGRLTEMTHEERLVWARMSKTLEQLRKGGH
jgi:hypothetical protein